jgi:uroporphyrin-III C-methyltransferase
VTPATKRKASTVQGTGRGRQIVSKPTGFVSLVGAGPGDPELLTVRALHRLQSADLVLFDGLTPPAIVDLAERAEHVSVARRVGRKVLTQDAVTALMIAAAREGRQVVRLKSGDPFVFGRGGEEVRALSDAGVAFEVIPGVTTATCGPAAAGIPVTFRGVASAFVVISGHEPASYEPVLAKLGPSVTVVIMMGLRSRARIAKTMIAGGWPRETPAAIVINAWRPDQRIWTGPLSALGRKNGVGSEYEPGVLVIGDAVSQAVRPARVRRQGIVRSRHGSP